MSKHRDDEMRMLRELMETAKDMCEYGAITEADLMRIRELYKVPRAGNRTQKVRNATQKRAHRTPESK